MNGLLLLVAGLDINSLYVLVPVHGVNGDWLFAAGIDAEVIKLVVVALIVIASAVIKMLGGQKPQPGPKREGELPQLGQKQPPRNPPQSAGNDPLQTEIEDFLRRASQRKNAPASQTRKQPYKGTAAERPIQAKPVTSSSSKNRPIGAEVEKHVEQYLDERKFKQRASSLGEKVAQADDKIDARLHQKFDHALGQLGPNKEMSAESPKATVEAYGSAAASLSSAAPIGFAALFANADNIRQAVILNEIFTRPEDRWA